MSYENNNKKENVTPRLSLEDIESGIQLIQGEPLICNHPRIKQLIETDFVLEDGRQVDPLNFATALIEYIETGKSSGKTQLDADTIERAMVEHSKTWVDERV